MTTEAEDTEAVAELLGMDARELWGMPTMRVIQRVLAKVAEKEKAREVRLAHLVRLTNYLEEAFDLTVEAIDERIWRIEKRLGGEP